MKLLNILIIKTSLLQARTVFDDQYRMNDERVSLPMLLIDDEIEANESLESLRESF